MQENSAVIVQNFKPEVGSRRVLLFNPPTYDIRFPWSRWQQPVVLLQLATLLINYYKCDVRLIDALYTKPNEKLTRRLVRVLDRGEISANYWRFGHLQSELRAQLNDFKNEGWQPDEIYVEGFTTFWWEGVVEAIKLVRQTFPQVHVILCGAYPTLATEHAVTYSGADTLVAGSIEGLAGLPLDLSLYPIRPSFTYLSIGTDNRSSENLINEFLAKANPTNQQERIRQFAFADHDVASKYPEQFRTLLKEVIDRKLKVNFYALGNIYARDFADDPELASLLFRAGFKRLAFADNRAVLMTEDAEEIYLNDHLCAVEYCIAAGYKWRTEELAAMACIGRPGEQMQNTTAFITKLAHIGGSIILVPYQPNPGKSNLSLPLELQNGKLFPFAEYNGLSYRAYQDLLGLAAVLNAKYRSNTFDFLGNGLISRLVRSSLVHESWDPQKNPGVQNERPVTVGWFNKEGKWVRS